MIFYTTSFGYSLKRDGKRLCHLVIKGRKHRTVCGQDVDNQGALWAFSDSMFIPTSDNMVSTVDTQREAVEWHITCKHCLAIHANGKV